MSVVQMQRFEEPSARPAVEELVLRARSMRPTLEGAARETEGNRRVSSGVMQELGAAQLLMLCKPKRFGGFEFGPSAMLRVGFELTKNGGDERLLTEYLFSDRFVCVVHRDHPLDETSSLEQYLSFPHVGLQMAGMVSSMESASLRRYAPQFEPTYMVAEFSQVACMVARTDLVGVVQERLAHNASRWLPVRTFKPPFDLSDLNEVMMWHPRHIEYPSHVWLRRILLDEARAWREEDGDAYQVSIPAPLFETIARTPLRVVG